MIKLFLVDHDPYSIAGLRQYLIEAPEIRIVGIAASIKMALQMLEALEDQRPQILLSRARLSDGTGIKLAMEIRERGWPLQILICCFVKATDPVDAIRRVDLSGYFLRDEETPENIIAAIRSIASGDKYYSPTINKMLAQPESHEEKLTNRQLEILHMVEQGLTNQGIAQELGIRKRTVDFQMERIMEKLVAKNRTEACFIARNKGWLR